MSRKNVMSSAAETSSIIAIMLDWCCTRDVSAALDMTFLDMTFLCMTFLV